MTELLVSTLAHREQEHNAKLDELLVGREHWAVITALQQRPPTAPSNSRNLQEERSFWKQTKPNTKNWTIKSTYYTLIDITRLFKGRVYLICVV